MTKQIENLTKKITPILKRHHISRASIFGSMARGEATKDSDVDLLVDFKDKKSLLDLARLQFEIQDVLHRDVDLLTFRSIDKKLKPYILKDAFSIYEQ